MKAPSEATKSAQLFRHPLLEKLAHTHIGVPLSIYFVGCTLLLYVGLGRGYLTPVTAVMFFSLGLLFWTFFEYMAHRYIFHMDTATPLRARIQYIFHGVHHDYPRDKFRLAMPPAASLLILTSLFFLIKWMMGNHVWAFLPGFVTGYSLYLMVHYAVHAYAPPKNFIHILWILHSIHHHKDQTVAFGVSSPLWDYLLGTMPPNTYRRKKKVGATPA